MDDSLFCPICKNKMRSTKLFNTHLKQINKFGNFIERNCPGTNHFVSFFTDYSSKKIIFIKTSLNHKLSKLIEIDFYNKESLIICINDGKYNYLNLDKILYPDFPNLDKLKDQVNTFLLFS